MNNASTVRALARRHDVLIFDQQGSMGLKSGAYGDNGRSRAPHAMLSAAMPATVGAERFSQSTMSPGCSVGHRTVLTQQRKMSPWTAPSTIQGASSPARPKAARHGTLLPEVSGT